MSSFLTWVIALFGFLATAVMFMTSGAAQDAIAYAAGLLFAAIVIAISAYINARYRRVQESDETQSTMRSASSDNAKMIGLVYLWGGLATLCVYYLTDLYWYHAWQYGGGMIIIAVCLFVFSRLVTKETSWFSSMRALNASAILSALQAVGALAGLIFLMSSGKLFASKSDWIANSVFLAGGLAILALSILAVHTHRALGQQSDGLIRDP